MATVLEHITGAMRLIGVAGEGQQVSPEMAQDALTAFNQLLDSWSTLGLVVYSKQAQEIPWASGLASKTVGPAGGFVGVRPVSVDRSSYMVSGGVYYPLRVISDSEFRAWCNDGLGGIPEYLYPDMTVPECTINLYPVPTASLSLFLVSIVELTQATSLDDDIVVPTGYLRAFKYNLAIEIAPEYGVEPLPTVQRIADSSLRAIKRTNMVNNKEGRMNLPPGLSVNTSSNIYQG